MNSLDQLDLENFAYSQFPSSFEDAIQRRNTFESFMKSFFPIDSSVKYNFIKVIGDGNCFFHGILRYFGYLTWLDLPNKDSTELNEEEEILYVITLSSLRERATEFIRNYLGQINFVLNTNVPEYQLICKFIADTMNLRIIVIEYNAFGSIELNKVYHFEPISGEFVDSAILINLGNHFTLVFPTSVNSRYDTKTTRKNVVDEMLTKAVLSEKLA